MAFVPVAFAVCAGSSLQAQSPARCPSLGQSFQTELHILVYVAIFAWPASNDDRLDA